MKFVRRLHARAAQENTEDGPEGLVAPQRGAGVSCASGKSSKRGGMLTRSVGVVGEGVVGGSVEWTEMESVVSLKKGLEWGEVSEVVVRGGAMVGNVGGSRGKSTVSVSGEVTRVWWLGWGSCILLPGPSGGRNRGSRGHSARNWRAS